MAYSMLKHGYICAKQIVYTSSAWVLFTTYSGSDFRFSYYIIIIMQSSFQTAVKLTNE